ncbi:MAG: ORF6N domain-containing protein [Nanoarchaeota archaeon]|nr:ORF6N domain-containing protein [Nanoarchaeota archaeon]
MENKLILNKEEIKSKIYTIRGLQVMLDEELAELYQVETKQLNRAVKRNIERFPERFMFQLTTSEYDSLRFQNGTLNKENLISQIATLKNKRGVHRKYLPYAFTEQGVAMLSGVLKSDIAIKISIQIIDAFVSMRRFISKNAEIFSRLDTVERKQLESQIKTDKNFEKVFEAIENKEFVKKQGIFFNGQIFDAYKFFSDIIRTASNSIVLIDNYIDDSVLTLFAKRKKNVKVTIFTKEISKQLLLDLKKYNSQYPLIEVKEFKQSHDRFLIIDNKEVYHIGASLKDLGKKWFAFSKFDKEAFTILDKLEKVK